MEILRPTVFEMKCLSDLVVNSWLAIEGVDPIGEAVSVPEGANEAAEGGVRFWAWGKKRRKQREKVKRLRSSIIWWSGSAFQRTMGRLVRKRDSCSHA